ncbi:MAG: hypothetical protein LBL49_10670 [Clostridiales Family XIII bacterium]|nr:hypothetical protein [Clostridiales Family XIII bacterium]
MSKNDKVFEAEIKRALTSIDVPEDEMPQFEEPYGYSFMIDPNREDKLTIIFSPSFMNYYFLEYEGSSWQS